MSRVASLLHFISPRRFSNHRRRFSSTSSHRRRFSLELPFMGEFTIQISNELVNQLVDDTVIKKKTRKTRRKVPREPEKVQSTVTGKPEKAAAPGWPVQAPLFLPPKPAAQPANFEIEGIRSVLRESEKVLESLQKQEENMLQEVTQKAKDLHDKEYKLPNPKPEPCIAERLATLTCYKEHIKDALKCSSLVTNFADCMRKFDRLGDK